MFELICNVLLWLGLLYAYCFNVLEAPIPDRTARNPYTLKPDIWPKAIIILLLICIAINIINIIRKNKNNPEFSLDSLLTIRARMCIGIALVLAASFILEPLGYMVTCFLVLFFYGLLLGQTHVIRLAFMSVILTLVLYVVFSVLLSVNLPRGTIPELRNFSLYIESIVASVKAAIM
ncbi:MAG: tripartite tricarboxylate transporter TctB family protein [Synergistaceae bacterium]|nr:tripartite tricarboxylate transporter TctB family protein [Synergistaceae bacterium]MBQ9405002.1 tripartite tricarboxylate transporter TctB family protein [Synergistaceae bacterium]MBQ9595748.1 tripartite tricarboxylate transporter TctB family protein [Synergistaceae bacterium]MBR0203785.1 tripartite tricarboxylate transporter TctB family protein [Synergistaceae bacterium]